MGIIRLPADSEQSFESKPSNLLKKTHYVLRHVDSIVKVKTKLILIPNINFIAVFFIRLTVGVLANVL